MERMLGKVEAFCYWVSLEKFDRVVKYEYMLLDSHGCERE